MNPVFWKRLATGLGYAALSGAVFAAAGCGTQEVAEEGGGRLPLKEALAEEQQSQVEPNEAGKVEKDPVTPDKYLPVPPAVQQDPIDRLERNCDENQKAACADLNLCELNCGGSLECIANCRLNASTQCQACQRLLQNCSYLNNCEQPGLPRPDEACLRRNCGREFERTYPDTPIKLGTECEAGTTCTPFQVDALCIPGKSFDLFRHVPIECSTDGDCGANEICYQPDSTSPKMCLHYTFARDNASPADVCPAGMDAIELTAGVKSFCDPPEAKLIEGMGTGVDSRFPVYERACDPSDANACAGDELCDDSNKCKALKGENCQRDKGQCVAMKYVCAPQKDKATGKRPSMETCDVTKGVNACSAPGRLCVQTDGMTKGMCVERCVYTGLKCPDTDACFENCSQKAEQCQTGCVELFERECSECVNGDPAKCDAPDLSCLGCELILDSDTPEQRDAKAAACQAKVAAAGPEASCGTCYTKCVQRRALDPCERCSRNCDEINGTCGSNCLFSSGPTCASCYSSAFDCVSAFGCEKAVIIPAEQNCIGRDLEGVDIDDACLNRHCLKEFAKCIPLGTLGTLEQTECQSGTAGDGKPYTERCRDIGGSGLTVCVDERLKSAQAPFWGPPGERGGRCNDREGPKCQEGLFCLTASLGQDVGTCVAFCDLGTGDICRRDLDCERSDSICHTEVIPRGVCARACRGDSDCRNLPALAESANISSGKPAPDLYADELAGIFCHIGFGGQCAPSCGEDADCFNVFGKRAACEKGRCVLPGSAETCTKDADCGAGDVCHQEIGRCGPGCIDDTTCAALGRSDLACRNNQCVVRTCQANGDCMAGDVCHFRGGTGICAPACPAQDCTDLDENFMCHRAINSGTCGDPCSDDSYCREVLRDEAAFCGKKTGECVLEEPVPACVADSDCAAGEICHREAGSAGLCAQPCPGASCQALGAGLVCNPLVNGGECLPACSSDAFCAARVPGLVCNQQSLACDTPPPVPSKCASNAECEAGEVCHTKADADGECALACPVQNCNNLVAGDVCHPAFPAGQCAPPCTAGNDFCAEIDPAFACNTQKSRCEKPAPPETGKKTVKFTISNLAPLDAVAEGHYELWFVVKGANVPVTKFNVVGNSVRNLAGTNLGVLGAEITLTSAQSLTGATEAMVTVEAPGDADASPSARALLKAVLTNDQGELNVAVLAAGSTTFTASNVSAVLDTPTDADANNGANGIWLASAGPAPVVALPALASGWAYEGWLIEKAAASAAPMSFGRFTKANEADSDGAGANAGPNPGYTLPGSDYVSGAKVLNLKDNFTLVVSVEPEPDNAASPFQLRPWSLVLSTISATGTAQATPVPVNTTGFPLGAVIVSP